MSFLVDFWPFWLGALALSIVSVGFVKLLGRGFGVSGVFARALDPEHELADDAAQLAVADAASSSTSAGPVRDPYLANVVFIVSVAVGGFLGAIGAGRFGESTYDGVFARIFGDGPLSILALVVGGVLVGFGTQMAGGCTSGHGLTGCARAQPGSLASTATFFGTGIVVSVLLDWVVS